MITSKVIQGADDKPRLLTKSPKGLIMAAGIETTSPQKSVPAGNFVGTFDVQKNATRLDVSFREAYSQQRYGYETQTAAPSLEGKAPYSPETATREGGAVEDMNSRLLNNITEIRAYLARLESHIQKA